MALNVRIIPRLDVKGPNVVKGVHMEGLRVVGTPRELAKRYFEQGADELLYMDIVASLYGRNLDLDLVRSVADELFVPFTVGGGIRSVHDINNVLRAGADKVAINTFAVRHPEMLTEAVRTFGAQCIVLSVEAKRLPGGSWEVYTDGGREHSGLDVIEWIKRALDQGIGEIILSSIDYDGTRKGFDMDLLKAVTAIATVPVIAHGGASNAASLHSALSEGHADALAVATILHYGDATVEGLKNDLRKQKIPVRSSTV